LEAERRGVEVRVWDRSEEAEGEAVALGLRESPGLGVGYSGVEDMVVDRERVVEMESDSECVWVGVKEMEGDMVRVGEAEGEGEVEGEREGVREGSPLRLRESVRERVGE